MTIWTEPAVASDAERAHAWKPPEPISADEWMQSRATPDCIVENYLFADVGVLIAPGGVGKTTLMLFESVHIALGRDLYGLAVRKPGRVLILTAEDGREMLVARLRAICADMNLNDAERRSVRDLVRISDVSGSGLRLTRVVDEVVVPTESVDALIDGCKELRPVLVVIDPAVSFGVGESRVNDAEQGLVEAARRLRNATGCCVRYIHHSGKANAREKTTDQYSGRGGSAFADGCRMVHVLQPLPPEDWRKATGDELRPGESGIVLARPKMSYCTPQREIYVKRTGYRFEPIQPTENDTLTVLEERADRIHALMLAELSRGRYPTRNSLEALDTGLRRAELRSVLSWLESTARVQHRDIPGAGSRGARKYLHPVFASPSDTAKPSEHEHKIDAGFADEKTCLGSPPPIGKKTAAKRRPPVLSPLPVASPKTHGEPTAKRATRELPTWASGDVEVL